MTSDKVQNLLWSQVERMRRKEMPRAQPTAAYYASRANMAIEELGAMDAKQAYAVSELLYAVHQLAEANEFLRARGIE